MAMQYFLISFRYLLIFVLLCLLKTVLTFLIVSVPYGPRFNYGREYYMICSPDDIQLKLHNFKYFKEAAIDPTCHMQIEPKNEGKFLSENQKYILGADSRIINLKNVSSDFDFFITEFKDFQTAQRCVCYKDSQGLTREINLNALYEYNWFAFISPLYKFKRVNRQEELYMKLVDEIAKKVSKSKIDMVIRQRHENNSPNPVNHTFIMKESVEQSFEISFSFSSKQEISSGASVKVDFDISLGNRTTTKGYFDFGIKTENNN